MITADDLREPALQWSARMWVDGAALQLAELPSRIYSFLRPRNTCTIPLTTLPAAAGRPAQVDLVLEGVGSVRYFTGYTDQRTARSRAWSREAVLVDRLGALDRALGTTISWSSTSFVDAVTELLDAAGIDAADIDDIFDPGSTYDLGPVYAIELEAKENIARLMAELMAFGGTALYVTPSGRIRVVDAPGIPSADAATVYARGATTGEFGISDAGIVIEGNEARVAEYTATGPTRPDGAVPDGTFTATGVSGKSVAKQYRFAQSDAVCQAIAAREVSRLARDCTNVQVEAPLNPLLAPGDSMLFRDAAIGFAASTPATITEIASNGMTMTLQIAVIQSPVDGYASSIAPPDADFSMRVEYQLVTLAGVPTATYLVQCQDESRDRAGYDITTRAWTASGTGASPTSSSEAAPIFLFTSLTGASISLTVTSETGESATVSKAPEAGDLQVLGRTVSVAAGGSGWRVLATTAGWRSYAGPGGGATCTAVPSFNESGPLLSGWSTGAIYSSPDALATTPSLLATLSGSIGALYVNEGNSAELLAGHGATLSRSTNSGATWASIGTFAADVTDCQSSPSNPSEIRVTAGDAMHVTYNGGASWAVAAQGATGSTAEALATAPWGRAAVFSDTALPVADAVVFEEAYTLDWSAVTGGDLPADGLSSITPMLEEEAFVVGEANDLVRDGVLPALVLSAGAGKLFKLTKSGTTFAASVLVPAVGSGAGKLVTLEDHYPIDSAAATSLGYGPLAALNAEVLLAPWGAAGAGDKVWRHVPGTGWVGVTPPSAGKYWYYIAASPFAPSAWLLMGNSTPTNFGRMAVDAGGIVRMADGTTHPLWYTSDNGATWTAVSLTSPVAGPLAAGADMELTRVEWLVQGPGWAVVRQKVSSTIATTLWRGSGSTAGSPSTNSGGITAALSLSPAQDDDLVIGPNGTSAKMQYQTSGGTYTTPSGSALGTDVSQGERIPGTRGVVFVGRTTFDLYATSDYRSAQPTLKLAGTFGTLAAMADGTVLTPGSSGVYRITDPTGSPVATLEAGTGVAWGTLRADRQTRTQAATRATDTVLVYDGANWGTLAIPTAASDSTLGPRIEILKRGA